MTALPIKCFDEDKWYLKNLSILTNYDTYNDIKSLNFKHISHPWLKIIVKKYILFLIKNKHTIVYVNSTLCYLQYLNNFIETLHINDIRNFTHKNTLDYIQFLNITHPTSYFLTRNLQILSKFSKWGAWSYPEQFPSEPVVKTCDYPKRVHKEPEYYTENEIEKIKSILPFTDKMTARMTLIMIYHGLRYSDISKTPITIGGHSCLIQNSDHQYIFEYFMSKTRRYNRIPVPEAIAKIIQIQIDSTKRKYGNDCNILFATDINKTYIRRIYDYRVNALAKKYKLTYDDGRPLRINTRMFRSTYATKLINAGVSPDTVRTLLGHKSVTVQNHYATIHGETMISLLTPLTKQDNNLILNIGNITESMCHIPDDYRDFIPLPNGSCTCAGDCNHQNACYTCSFYIPQKDFLPTYKLQLEQAELAIEEARKYNHTAFMEKNTALRNVLKSIISALEAENNETG